MKFRSKNNRLKNSESRQSPTKIPGKNSNKDTISEKEDSDENDRGKSYSGFGRQGAGPGRRGKPTFNKFKTLAVNSNKSLYGDNANNINIDPNNDIRIKNHSNFYSHCQDHQYHHE